MLSRIWLAITVLVISLPFVCLYAANTPAGANSDPTYQQLRNLTLSGEAVSVTNIELKRDAGTFHLHSGTVCFVTPGDGQGYRRGVHWRSSLRARSI